MVLNQSGPALNALGLLFAFMQNEHKLSVLSVLSVLPVLPDSKKSQVLFWLKASFMPRNATTTPFL